MKILADHSLLSSKRFRHAPKNSLKSGFSLVEVLVALVVISLAVGVVFLSVVNLLGRSNQAAMLINLAEVLMNQAELYLNMDISSIDDVTYTTQYATRTYRVTVTVNDENLASVFQLFRNVGTSSSPQYQPVAWPQHITRSGFRSVTIRVTDDMGRYIETKVFPKQW